MKKVFIMLISMLIVLNLSGCKAPSFVDKNNASFKEAVRAINTDEILLKDIVPFEWDIMYNFTPYTSREKIEEIIGFHSDDIIETVNEGMTQLLFVKDNQVVSSICGFSSHLGYSLFFGGYEGDYISISSSDNAVFTVSSFKGVVNLVKKSEEEGSGEEVLELSSDNYLYASKISISDYENLVVAVERVNSIDTYSYYVIRLYNQGEIVDEYSLFKPEKPDRKFIFKSKIMELYDYDNNGEPEFWIPDGLDYFSGYSLFTISKDLKISLVDTYIGSELITDISENQFMITKSSGLIDSNDLAQQHYLYTYSQDGWDYSIYEAGLNLDREGSCNDIIKIENISDKSKYKPIFLSVTLNGNITLKREFPSDAAINPTVFSFDFCKKGTEQIVVYLTDRYSNYHASQLYILEVVNGELVELLAITDDTIREGIEKEDAFFVSLFGNMPVEKRMNYSYLTFLSIVPANETYGTTLGLVLGYLGRDSLKTYMHWDGTKWSDNKNIFKYTETYDFETDQMRVISYE